jgi:hypothetical protein
MKGLDEVASAVRKILLAQAELAKAGKERFGDWNSRLARALRESVEALYLASARSAKAKEELLPQFLAQAKARAITAAASINETTTEWLQEGRDIPEVFGPARVVRIATYEARYAMSAGVAIVGRSKGKKLRWKVGRKPCKWCRAMNGIVVEPGTPFGNHGGVPVYVPPAHPHCYCKVELV